MKSKMCILRKKGGKSTMCVQSPLNWKWTCSKRKLVYSTIHKWVKQHATEDPPWYCQQKQLIRRGVGLLDWCYTHIPCYYSKASMTRTPMTRLPWLIRIRFSVPRKIFRRSWDQENKCLNFYFLFILSWKCMLCVLIRIASPMRF